MRAPNKKSFSLEAAQNRFWIYGGWDRFMHSQRELGPHDPLLPIVARKVCSAAIEGYAQMATIDAFKEESAAGIIVKRWTDQG